jgi:hypothetical protein
VVSELASNCVQHARTDYELRVVLEEFALTPSARGPISNLSGAVAALTCMAATGGTNIALEAFKGMTAGNVARSCALGFPELRCSWSQAYRNLRTVTGDSGRAGHDPSILLPANLEVLQQLRRSHRRLGEAASVDVTRLAAPVPQLAPPKHGRYEEAIKRAGLEGIGTSTYERDGQYSTVVGWKGGLLVDEATTLALTWSTASGNTYEPDMLGVMFQQLFSRTRGARGPVAFRGSNRRGGVRSHDDSARGGIRPVPRARDDDDLR